MLSMILVALGAVITRWLGEVARGVEAPRAAQLGGWVWAMGSVWLAAALLGAWAPAWPVLPLALLGWASVAAAPRRLVELTSDVLAAFVFAALAVPALPLLATFGLALLVLVGGEALHRLRPRRKIRRSAIEVGATIAVLLAGYAAACAWAQQDMNPRPIHGLFTPSVGVMLPFDPAERVDLDTGAAAWLAEPHRPQWGSSGPRRGALVFHGADSDGSHQKAARVLRRALLSAGYTVLLVDHPGYGQSPTPALDAPIEAWDPLPTALAGLRVLTGQLGVSRIMIVGHSMGCVDALRLAAALDSEQLAGSVSAVVLFGGAVSPRDAQSSREAYWQRRFLSDRRLAADALDAATVQAIRERYYMIDTYARQLGPDHAPVLFVRFGREFDDIRQHRDALMSLIPGVVRVWDLDSTHYFNTADYQPLYLAIGDVGVARQVADRLRWVGLGEAAGGLGPSAPAR